MADHQPHFGAQNGDMVARRLGVGRAHSDVDQCDAAAVLGHQMIGRHLVAAPLPRRDLRLGVGQLARLVQRARHRQRREARVLPPQRVDCDTDELVDVADIVGEQHELLEMLGGRAGVVAKPREAEVGARAIKQGERPRLVRPAHPDSVGDLVAQVDELVRWEIA